MNDLVNLAREVLDHDPDSGIFRWKLRKSGFGPVRLGNVAGSVHRVNGYRYLSLMGRKFGAHRIALIYMDGVVPAGDVDHINGVRDDNRYCNLRSVTRSVNMQNIRRPRVDNTHGNIGVVKADKRFAARIGVDGVVHFLGTFATAEHAAEAYLVAKRALHPGCTI